MPDIVDIRYRITTEDRGTRQVLDADRRVQQSIRTTIRGLTDQARQSRRTGSDAARAASVAARAFGQTGRAATRAGGSVGRLATSLRASEVNAARAARTADRAASSYRRMAVAAERAARGARRVARDARGGVGAGGIPGRGLAVAGAAGAGIGFAAATRAGVDFEQQMDRIQAVAGATTKQMARMDAQAIRLGERTSFSASEAAAGMRELATMGFNAEQILKTMPGTIDLAAASMTDLAFAANTQAAMIRQFGMRTSDAAHVADVMTLAVNKSAIEMEDLAETMSYVGPVAGRMNQSFEDMAGATAILGNVGIVGSRAGTTLRRALNNLIKPSMRTMTALEGAGISARDFAQMTTDSEGRLRKLPEIIGNLAGAMEGMRPVAKQKIIAQLFGVEALPGMITLIGKGEKAIDKMADSMRASGGTAGKTAKIMRDNVAGAWDEFAGSVETASITLTRRFRPALADALRGGAGNVNALVAGLTGRAAARPAAPRAGVARTEGMGRGPRAGAEPSTFQRIGTVMRTAATSALTFGRSLLKAIAPAKPLLMNVILPLAKGIGQGILGALKMVLPIINVFAKALGWLGNLLKPLKPVFEGIGVVIGVLFGGPLLASIRGLGRLGAVIRLVGRGLTAFQQVVGRVIGGAFRILGRLATGAAQLIGRGISAIGRTFGRLPGALLGIAGRAVGSVVRRLGGLVSGIGNVGKRAVDALVGWFSKLPGRIADVFRRGVGFAAGVGRAIADWLNKHTPLGDNVDVGPISFRLPSLRGGGRMNAMLARVSPGELLVTPSGQTAMVPGRPVAADNTLVSAPRGTAVLTASGQAMMAAGASMGQALANQLPHFRRGGFMGGALMAGYERGVEGGRLGAEVLRDIISGAVPESHRRLSRARGGGGAPRSDDPRVQGMLNRAEAIAARRLPYTYGGGHGGFGSGNPGFDCSGYVSAILGPGVLPRPMAVRQPMASALVPGAGRIITVGLRGSSGKQAHTMVRIGTRYYESGGGHGPAKVGGWNGAFDLFHPRGFQRGGRIGGAITGVGAARGRGDATSALRGLGNLVDDVTLGRLQAAHRRIAGMVRQLRAGDEDRRQEAQIRQLTGALKLVDAEIGRRIGRGVRRAARIVSGIGRRQTLAERVGRRAGVDASSVEGIEGAQRLRESAMSHLTEARATLTTQLERAKRTGNRKLVGRVREQLNEVVDQIDETYTTWIEGTRELAAAQRQRIQEAAQRAVDAAANVTSLRQARLAGLELEQRLAGNPDAASARTARADFIKQQIVPALNEELAKLKEQMAHVDDKGAQEVAIQQKQNEILQAQLDAQELTAANTEAMAEALANFSGTLGFEFGGQSFTDAITLGVGA